MTVTFDNPGILVLALLLPVVLWFMRVGERRRRRVLAAFHENPGATRWRTVTSLILIPVLLLSLLIAAAGPRRYLAPAGGRQAGNFVFLVDVSRSMAARPDCSERTRLDRARSLMLDVMRSLPSAKFAFITFAGLAFPFSELTLDRDYLQAVVEHGITIEAVPVPGSDLANALQVAAEKKQAPPRVYGPARNLILISDGDISDEVSRGLNDAVQTLHAAGLRVISVGVGSASGMPVPAVDDSGRCLHGRYQRADGKEYTTYLFDKPLRGLSEQTGGRYFRETERRALIAYLHGLMKPGVAHTAPRRTEDISAWFLALATLALLGLAGIRRP